MREEYHGEEIKGIPGYYVNMETQEVWSRRLVIGRCGVEREKWLRLKRRKINRSWYFSARVNKRHRNLSVTRAMLSVEQNVPYDKVNMKSQNPNERHGLKIPGIQDCYIDEEKHEVWGFTNWSNTEGKAWRKKRLIKKSGVEYFSFVDGQRERMASFNRALFCAKNKIDYYNENLSKYFFHAEGKKAIPVDRGDCVSDARKMKKKRIAYERTRRIGMIISALQLLENAYKGDARPLLDYVTKKKASYIYILEHSKYNLSTVNALAGYEFAMSKLIEEVREGGCLIFDLDGWFIKTAYGSVMRESINRLRSFNVEELNSVKCSTPANW